MRIHGKSKGYCFHVFTTSFLSRTERVPQITPGQYTPSPALLRASLFGTSALLGDLISMIKEGLRTVCQLVSPSPPFDQWFLIRHLHVLCVASGSLLNDGII